MAKTLEEYLLDLANKEQFWNDATLSSLAAHRCDGTKREKEAHEASASRRKMTDDKSWHWMELLNKIWYIYDRKATQAKTSGDSDALELSRENLSPASDSKCCIRMSFTDDEIESISRSPGYQTQLLWSAFLGHHFSDQKPPIDLSCLRAIFDKALENSFLSTLCGRKINYLFTVWVSFLIEHFKGEVDNLEEFLNNINSEFEELDAAIKKQESCCSEADKQQETVQEEKKLNHSSLAGLFFEKMKEAKKHDRRNRDSRCIKALKSKSVMPYLFSGINAFVTILYSCNRDFNGLLALVSVGDESNVKAADYYAESTRKISHEIIGMESRFSARYDDPQEEAKGDGAHIVAQTEEPTLTQKCSEARTKEVSKKAGVERRQELPCMFSSRDDQQSWSEYPSPIEMPLKDQQAFYTEELKKEEEVFQKSLPGLVAVCVVSFLTGILPLAIYLLTQICYAKNLLKQKKQSLDNPCAKNSAFNKSKYFWGCRSNTRAEQYYLASSGAKN